LTNWNINSFHLTISSEHVVILLQFVIILPSRDAVPRGSLFRTSSRLGKEPYSPELRGNKTKKVYLNKSHVIFASYSIIKIKAVLRLSKGIVYNIICAWISFSGTSSKY
jgi:hypothetical protein